MSSHGGAVTACLRHRSAFPPSPAASCPGPRHHRQRRQYRMWQRAPGTRRAPCQTSREESFAPRRTRLRTRCAASLSPSSRIAMSSRWSGTRRCSWKSASRTRSVARSFRSRSCVDMRTRNRGRISFSWPYVPYHVPHSGIKGTFP
jgi:hypothetical protein